MTIDWLDFFILALASWRTFHLLAHDDLMDKPRRYITRAGDWKEGEAAPKGYRYRLGEFIECPYCLGFWIAMGWWAAWLIFPDVLYAAVPFALSALLTAIHKFVSDE